MAKVPLPAEEGGIPPPGPIGPPIILPPIGPPGPIIGPRGPGPPCIGGPLGLIPIPAMLSSPVGEESWTGVSPLEEKTGLPSGPSMAPPSGELIMPGSRLPMEPSPLSGPGPTELGVEQGVEPAPPGPASCWDIWAMLLIGSKPLLDMLVLVD